MMTRAFCVHVDGVPRAAKVLHWVLGSLVKYASPKQLRSPVMLVIWSSMAGIMEEMERWVYLNRTRAQIRASCWKMLKQQWSKSKPLVELRDAFWILENVIALLLSVMLGMMLIANALVGLLLSLLLIVIGAVCGYYWARYMGWK